MGPLREDRFYKHVCGVLILRVTKPDKNCLMNNFAVCTHKRQRIIVDLSAQARICDLYNTEQC